MNKPANTSDLSTIKKYIKNISNINLDSINSPCLPKSKSYLKIVGLLHKMENNLITPNFIKSVVKELHLFENIMLASKPHIIKALSKSDMAVVWMNIWDFQSSFAAKNIINCQVNVGRYCQVWFTLGVKVHKMDSEICGLVEQPWLQLMCYTICLPYGHNFRE